MNNVIKQLKKNEKPFGLMSEEMQEKAREIGKIPFEYYASPISWLNANPSNPDFCSTNTYRLRPDCAEKPEIEECEIKPFKEYGESLRYKKPTNHAPYDIFFALSDPDFIGLKAHGRIWGMLYKHKGTGDLFLMIPADLIDDYDVCDMTNAHVLFRRRK